MGLRSRQFRGIIVRLRYKRPVGIDLALPRAWPLARQAMSSVVRMKRLSGHQPTYDAPQPVRFPASLPGAFDVSFEMTRGKQSHASTMRRFEVVESLVLG